MEDYKFSGRDCPFYDGSSVSNPSEGVTRLLKLLNISVRDGATNLFPFSESDVGKRKIMTLVIFMMDLYNLLSGSGLTKEVKTRSIKYWCGEVGCTYFVDFKVDEPKAGLNAKEATLLQVELHRKSCPQLRRKKNSRIDATKVSSFMKTTIVVMIALQEHCGVYQESWKASVKAKAISLPVSFLRFLRWRLLHAIQSFVTIHINQHSSGGSSHELPGREQLHCSETSYY
jgi:hypothetical protein